MILWDVVDLVDIEKCVEWKNYKIKKIIYIMEKQKTTPRAQKLNEVNTKKNKK